MLHATLRKTGTVRMITYNVHRWIGMDGKRSPERIGDVVMHYTPDIVALQEAALGNYRHRGNPLNLIAHNLGMNHLFSPTCRIRGEVYGNAIMSHFPMRLVKTGILRSLPNYKKLEPRGAIWAEVETGSCLIQVVNTHLGLNQRERVVQADDLLSPDWVGNPACREPIVLCGDFNCTPAASVYKRFSRNFHDVQVVADNHRPRKTWTGLYPLFRIDHIFISPLCEVANVSVGNTWRARVASDHLPLVVDLYQKDERLSAQSSQRLTQRV